MLVLLAGLILAFFRITTAEQQAAARDSAFVSTQALSDLTTDLVISHIREATTRYTETAAWSSQPGAIRTFSGTENDKSKVSLANGATQKEYTPGADDYVFKLYSASEMKVRAADYRVDHGSLREEVEITRKWVEDPVSGVEGYVDINEPLLLPREGDNGTFYEAEYPIFDPRAAANAKGDFKINGFGVVDGFAANTVWNTSDTRKGSDGKPIPLLPMPVKWLYVMRDGTIGPMTRATERNPIVGRTAFWTDDECAKINVNVASDGTFWDTPSVSTAQESGNVDSSGSISSPPNSLSLGAAQPIRGEVQRYPGHPATTSLSPVLGWIWNLPRTPMNPTDSRLLGFKEAVYRMAPFVVSGKGTSRGGTANATTSLVVSPTGELDVMTATKHLYVNPDEYLFQSERFEGPLTDPHGLVQERLTPESLSKVKPFITATSRGSDLNVFNRPRITFWPVNANTAKRTQFDHLFAFASTIGNEPFIFTRTEAKDPIVDISLKQNRDMFAYLQWLTGGPGTNARTMVPGFGGNFLKKYGPDRDQILTLIYDYVRSVNLVDTGTNRLGTLKFIPYTPFFGQTSVSATALMRSYDWSGQVTPTEVPEDHPLAIGLKGMGRFPMITEAALAFYRTGRLMGPAQNERQIGMRAILMFELGTTMPGYPALRETYWTKVRVSRDTKVTPIFKVVSEGKPVEQAGVKQAVFSAADPALINIPNLSNHEIYQGRGFMPTLGFMAPFYYYPEHFSPTNPDAYPIDPAKPDDPVASPPDPARNPSSVRKLKRFGRTVNEVYQRGKTVESYPYIGPDPATNGDGAVIYRENNQGEKLFAPEFEFEGGRFEVEIWSGEAPDHPKSRLVQTVVLDFGDPGNCKTTQRLPVPDIGVNQDGDIWRKFVEVPSDMDAKWNPFRDNQTTVRSIEFIGPVDGRSTDVKFVNQRGDLRLGMALKAIPPGYFAPRDRARWEDSSVRVVHGFNDGHGDKGDSGNISGYSASNGWGVLAAGSRSYIRDLKHPVLPAGVDGVTMINGAPGDWDRGLSKHMDGAFGNKADEGNIAFTLTAGGGGGRVPYYRGRGIEEVGQSFFTPNRQLPSAVMFGSLPTGILAGKPWQTLLFRPDRSAIPHPGASIPEDHLILDLFQLPIVEPFSISEPVSTIGKVNPNFVIAPFGYLDLRGKADGSPNRQPTNYLYRDTALRGVLQSTKMMAVDTTAPQLAHQEEPMSNGSTYRFDIDLNATIAPIHQRLLDSRLGLFRTASEICTVDLYPQGKTVTNWANFWDRDHTQTGDNMRERPYAHIYPRLTTKSNVYTVHMRCQTLQVKETARRKGKIDYASLTESDFDIQGEYRGSATIERYIDPNDEQLKVDGSRGGNDRYDYRSGSLDPYYRFRVIAVHRLLGR